MSVSSSSSAHKKPGDEWDQATQLVRVTFLGRRGFSGTASMPETLNYDHVTPTVEKIEKFKETHTHVNDDILL